jgi:hypothetical protein
MLREFLRRELAAWAPGRSRIILIQLSHFKEENMETIAMLREWSCQKRCLAWFCLLAPLLIGCATNNYRFGRFGESAISYADTQKQIIEQGGVHPKLDRIERFLHAPGRKLSKWFGEPYDPNREKQKQVQALETSMRYLTDHNLQDVHVEVRRYEPSEQWRRLRSNTRIHPIFKYTDGAARVFVSTVLPNRVFHSDSYNPYTNTLSINSDSPSSALIESAASRYSHSAGNPGWRAASQNLPFVSIYHQSKIASEALSYVQAKQEWPLEKELYPAAYGSIGSSVFLEGYALSPVTGPAGLIAGPAASMVGSAAGSGLGNMAAKKREKERRP